MSAEENVPGSPTTEQSPAAPATGDSSARAGAASLDFVIDVPLDVTVELGSTRMLVKEVLQLARGSVIPLDRLSGDPADILVNGRVVARGEITLVDDRIGVRVTQLIHEESERDAS